MRTIPARGTTGKRSTKAGTPAGSPHCKGVTASSQRLSLIFVSALVLSPALATAPRALAIGPTRTSAPVATAPLLEGVAVPLECTTTPQGRVAGCFVLDEAHPGPGFGEAAMALMQDAEIEPVPEPLQFARTIQFIP
jgi:TonB family protein